MQRPGASISSMRLGLHFWSGILGRLNCCCLTIFVTKYQPMTQWKPRFHTTSSFVHLFGVALCLVHLKDVKMINSHIINVTLPVIISALMVKNLSMRCRKVVGISIANWFNQTVEKTLFYAGLQENQGTLQISLVKRLKSIKLRQHFFNVFTKIKWPICLAIRRVGCLLKTYWSGVWE